MSLGISSQSRELKCKEAAEKEMCSFGISKKNEQMHMWIPKNFDWLMLKSWNLVTNWGQYVILLTLVNLWSNLDI